jgi:predicted Zn-dependent protease
LRHGALHRPQSIHFILVNEGQEASLSDEAYRHTLRDSVVTHDINVERIVRRVGEKIAAVANQPAYEWEFTIIDEPQTVNAFALPGGKVAVYTGIFGPARDEAGLAVVVGHEVADALARYPAQRMSQGLLIQFGGVGLGVALGRTPRLPSKFCRPTALVLASTWRRLSGPGFAQSHCRRLPTWPLMVGTLDQ